ncbi:hypothetical protein [Rhizobium sp. NFR12]|uniref:hypothetical protein n=1 Tax=Rhizobium sp. NFR12 TaxID=1566261 RepID=UPI00111479F8|nr:hypothetical protein [Rhizobium sp. NFR12]
MAGVFMSNECLCIIVLDTCLRRRNLTMIHERPFLRRWLALCEPGVLFYLRNMETTGDWKDLKDKIHAIARRSHYTVPDEMRNLARERLVFIGAVLREISAIGSYLQGNPNNEFIPDPDPTPDVDKDGSGGEGGSGGGGGQARTSNGVPTPSPSEAGVIIHLTEDELAAILDAAADDDDAGVKMGAML